MMTVESRLEWDKASDLVSKAERILVVTHISPDGDAIGSMIGIVNALRAQGKTVDAAVDEGLPGFLSFIEGGDTIRPQLSEGTWDVMISTDASDEERTGAVGAYGRANTNQVINLDHHMTNLFFGDVHLVQVDAVSATQIVWRWLKYMDMPLTKEIAVPLLTGLVTDTMGFRTSNITAGTLGIAQDLMQAGASITEVMARTLDSKPYRSFKLWSGALQSLSLDDQIVSVNITQADMQATGVTDVSDAGLVGMLNQINEAMIAVIFMELAGGKQVKLSLRAKNGYDVGSVAMSIGGGGHRLAAGATVNGTLDHVRERVMPMLKQAVAEGELVIA